MFKNHRFYKYKIHYLAFRGHESNIENMRFLEASMDIKVDKKENTLKSICFSNKNR